jgi:hypothetical protein
MWTAVSLHCVYRNGDRGDQRVFYREQRKAVSLHKVWDTFILRDAMKGTPVAQYAEKLAAGISNEQAAAWAKGAPEAWASEGRAAAARSAVRGRARRRSAKAERGVPARGAGRDRRTIATCGGAAGDGFERRAALNWRTGTLLRQFTGKRGFDGLFGVGAELLQFAEEDKLIWIIRLQMRAIECRRPW